MLLPWSVKHKERIRQLEAEFLCLKNERVERFVLRCFQGSDADIDFYTGLPTVGVLCTFNISSSTYIRAHTRQPTLPFGRCLGIVLTPDSNTRTSSVEGVLHNSC